MNNPSSANKFMLFFMVWAVLAMVVVGMLSVIIGADKMEPVLLFGNHIILFAIPILIFMLVFKIPVRHLASFKPIDIKNVLLVIGISFLVMPVMGFIGSVTALFTDNEVSKTVIEYIEIYPFWLCFFSTAIMPAVFEELAFRGLILNGYKRMGAGIALSMSALFFGIMHMDAYQFFYATAVGLLFGAMVYYSGSIWTSVLSHLIINGSQVVMAKLALMSGMGDVAMDMEITTDDKLMVIVVYGVITVIVMPFLIVLVMAFIKRNKGKNIDYIYDLGEDEISQGLAYKQGRVVDLSVVLTVVIFILIILVQSLM